MPGTRDAPGVWWVAQLYLAEISKLADFRRVFDRCDARVLVQLSPEFSCLRLQFRKIGDVYDAVTINAMKCFLADANAGSGELRNDHDKGWQTRLR
jgi:hypothetical protein